MEAGLNLFSLRTLIQTEEDFLRTAERLKSLGYSFLQFSGAPFDAARLARIADKTGMPFALTHVPYERIVSDTDALADEHALFGCKNVGLGYMDTSDDGKVAEAAAALEEAAVRLEKRGFGFFYHHHYQEFRRMAGGETVLGFMLEKAPHIRLTIDSYWLQYGGVNPAAFAASLAGRCDCAHLKDYAIVPDGAGGFKPDFAPVGSGTLDMAEFTAAAKQSGAKYFFVEQDNACLKADPFLEAGTSIRYVRERL